MTVMKNHTKDSRFAWIVFAIAGFFLFYEMHLEVSASVTSQEIMGDFHIGAESFGTSMSFFFWSLSGLQLFVGYLFDRYPLKKLMLLGVGMCSLSLGMLSVVHDVYLMYFARFLLGFGSSFAWVSMLMVGIQWFSEEGYDLKAGIAQFTAAAGGMVGGTVVAHLVGLLSWRQTFMFFAGIGLVLWAIIAWVVDESPKTQESQVKADDTWPLKRVLKTAYSSWHAWAIALYTFGVFAPVTGFFEVWGGPYLMQYYGKTAEQVSYLFYAFWIGLAVAALGIGWLAGKLGKRVILMGVCAGSGALCFAMILWGPHLSEPLMMIMLAGIGICVAGQVLSFPLARDWHDNHIIATVIGLINFCGMVTGVLLSWWIGRGLEHGGAMANVNGVPIYSLHAYQENLWIFPVLAFGALMICCVALREKNA